MDFSMLFEFPNVLILAFILFLIIAIVITSIYSRKIKNNKEEVDDNYNEVEEEPIEFINSLLDDGTNAIEITDEEVEEYENSDELVEEEVLEKEEEPVEVQEEHVEFVPLEIEKEDDIVVPIKEVKEEEIEENIETL